MMPWLDQRDNWLPKSEGAEDEAKPRRRRDPVLRVGEAAAMLGVDRRTLLKYLSDEEGGLLRYGEDWFRLPSGYIRIYRAAIERLRD